MQEAHKTRDKEAILYLYDKILPALAVRIHHNLSEITPLFHNFFLEKVVDTWTKDPELSNDTPISIENGNVQQMGLRLRLEGFQSAGAPPFDVSKDLLFKLRQREYEVCPDKKGSCVEKYYLQPWTETETRNLAQRWCDELIDEITQQLERLT